MAAALFRLRISREESSFCTSILEPILPVAPLAKDFSRLQPAFAKAGIAVVGVSADPVKKQDAFKTRHALTTPLASDETHQMLEAYGVWMEKSMYGKKYMGINRTTVLIGTDGRIARIWPKVKIEGHAEEVLAAAKAI